jgi:hypothetical protein
LVVLGYNWYFRSGGGFGVAVGMEVGRDVDVGISAEKEDAAILGQVVCDEVQV